MPVGPAFAGVEFYATAVGLWRMGSSRMMVVQIDSEVMAQRFIPARGIFEQALLKVTGKVRPKLERGPTHQMFKT